MEKGNVLGNTAARAGAGKGIIIPHTIELQCNAQHFWKSN